MTKKILITLTILFNLIISGNSYAQETSAEVLDKKIEAVEELITMTEEFTEQTFDDILKGKKVKATTAVKLVIDYAQACAEKNSYLLTILTYVPSSKDSFIVALNECLKKLEEKKDILNAAGDALPRKDKPENTKEIIQDTIDVISNGFGIFQ